MNYMATLSRRGQITVPQEVLDRLNLEPGDRIEFVIDGEEVRLRRLATLREIAGSLPLIGVSVEEAIEIARAERGTQLAEKYAAMGFTLRPDTPMSDH